MSLLLILLLVGFLAAILAQPPIAKALRAFIGDRKELALFAQFEIAAIGAVALLMLLAGPRVGGIVLILAVCLLALWAMKPPAQKR